MDKRPNIKKRIALELFRSIKKNRAKLHELRTLFWECTLRCNVSCRHCGSDCHVSASVPDMPVEDFLKVIDDITPYVEPNKVLVIFTGGEALVRKDIEKCGLELYRRGYPWGIVSNGYLMTRERLDSLLASGLHSATISLDGFEEAHNWLRRNPKSFEKALNAICMLAEEKEIIWDVVTCVNQHNFKDLMLFKDFLIEMGGDFTFIGNQYHLMAGNRDLYIDLLLFHRRLRSLVAIELKIGEFEAEYAGKMQLYLTALDEQIKLPDENPSIGIIICKSKDKTYVEYALKNINMPIGVATYQLRNTLPEEMKEMLPEPEEIVKRLKVFEKL